MPNYTIIADGHYRPFTYQELAAPLDRQDAYHEHLMEQYEKLSSQADILEAMGANDRDNKSGAYSQFKAYSDNLRNERDLLYKRGLDPNSRLRLAEMRRRYNTEIVPIQNAWTKREQEADMQMKAQMQNPSLRFTRDARTSTLDEYLANPTGGFGVVNLNAISADMAAMAKSLEGQIRSGQKIDGIDSTTYNYIQKYGLDASMINEWLKNPQANPTLTNMRDQVLAKHGVTAEALQGSKNAASLMQEGLNAANMGAWASIGKDTSQLHTDQAKVMALQDAYAERREARQYARALNLEREKARLAGGGEGNDSMGDTVALNFNDPTSAGLSMKRKLAEATAEYIYNVGGGNAQSKKIKAYWDKHGGREAAIKHWETNGFNGSEEWLGKGNSSISDRLGNYLKKTVTDNNDIINIWKSGYEQKKLPTRGSMGNMYDRNYYEAYKGKMDERTRKNYEEGLALNEGKARGGIKNWRNFDSLSSNGYEVNAVVLRDDPSNLEDWLDRTLSRNMRAGNVKLYDIKKIDANNNYTYSGQGSTSRKDLPQDSNGKIDYSRIHRAKLSNGDYLLYWDDGNETKQKVLRLQDVSKEALSDRDKKDLKLQSIDNLYNQKKISKEQREALRKQVLNQDISNSMDITRRYNVEEIKI